MEIKCTKCVAVIGERDNGVVRFGEVMAAAPCEVMCSNCGTVNKIPGVPFLNGEPKPLEVVIVDKGKK